MCYKNNGWNFYILLINLDLVTVSTWAHGVQIITLCPEGTGKAASIGLKHEILYVWWKAHITRLWMGWDCCASLTWFQGNTKKKPFSISNLHIYPYLLAPKDSMNYGEKFTPTTKRKMG